MSALKPRISDLTPILTGGTDLFLYNPRKAAAAQVRFFLYLGIFVTHSCYQGKILAVQNEALEFIVVLQNPYIFDLELESISLRCDPFTTFFYSHVAQVLPFSTSGITFDTKPLRVLIPANSLHEVVLSGKPLETGTLVIRGCRVQAPGGASREFTLPLSTDEEEERLSRKRSSLACETGRSKYSGIESFPWEKSRQRTSSQPTHSKPATSSFRFLECMVVPEQPLLRIRRTSVTHGAVMLYDGEMCIVSSLFLAVYLLFSQVNNTHHS